MSTFIVENVCINRILSYIDSICPGYFGMVFTEEYTIDVTTNTGREALGLAMHDLNVAAYEARYEVEKGPFENFKHEYVPAKIIQVYADLSCLLYNCNEGDISERGLYKTLQDLKEFVGCAIIENHPDWNKITWGT